MIKMTIFPSTSQPRAACTWARAGAVREPPLLRPSARALHHTRPARSLLPIPLPLRLLRQQSCKQRGFGRDANT